MFYTVQVATVARRPVRRFIKSVAAIGPKEKRAGPPVFDRRTGPARAQPASKRRRNAVTNYMSRERFCSHVLTWASAWSWVMP